MYNLHTPQIYEIHWNAKKKTVSGIQNTDEYIPKLRENSVNQNPHRTNKNVRIFIYFHMLSRVGKNYTQT